MAKRFIDSELFCDEWFCDLSKDSKLFFIYFITRCDHAGILKLNNKLCEFQTGIENIETVIKDLSNCLITVKSGVYFMPKYIKFQYPGFPKSSVKQQDSALKILISLGLWDKESNSYLTVNEELNNSYDNDSDSDNDSVYRMSGIKNPNNDPIITFSEKLYKAFKNAYPDNKDIPLLTVSEFVKPLRELIKREYSQEQISAIAQFSYEDTFWNGKVTDTTSLLKHFEKLKDKYKKEIQKV